MRKKVTNTSQTLICFNWPAEMAGGVHQKPGVPGHCVGLFSEAEASAQPHPRHVPVWAV